MAHTAHSIFRAGQPSFKCGVTVFHADAAGEDKIQVIVGQQDMAESLEILRFMSLQPQNLGRGVAGEHGITDKANDTRRTSEVTGDFSTFRHGAGIAPELGRADHLGLGVEGNEAVLLPRNTDGTDLASSAAQLTNYLMNGGIKRLHPGGGMLFHRTRRQTGEDIVSAAGMSDDLPSFRIERYRLGALRSTIDTECKGHGYSIVWSSLIRGIATEGDSIDKVDVRI